LWVSFARVSFATVWYGMPRLVHILVIPLANLLSASKMTNFGRPLGMKDGVNAALQTVVESALSMNTASANELMPSRQLSIFNSPHFNGKSPGVQTSRNSTLNDAWVLIACRIDCALWLDALVSLQKAHDLTNLAMPHVMSSHQYRVATRQ
jgi:hypothetical protein